MAALAAALATLGSTAAARKATVLIRGLPDLLKGMGWLARGPEGDQWVQIIRAYNYIQERKPPMTKNNRTAPHTVRDFMTKPSITLQAYYL